MTRPTWLHYPADPEYKTTHPRNKVSSNTASRVTPRTQAMAVHHYLTIWNLGHLCDRFKNTSFTTFLGMTRHHALHQYGEEFADRHQRLCNQLRNVLYSKRLMDTTHENSLQAWNKVQGQTTEATCIETTSALAQGTGGYPTEGVVSPMAQLAVSPVPPRAPVKSRLGLRRRDRSALNHAGGKDRIRRNLSYEFEAVNMYCTPRRNKQYTSKGTRVPVKARLGAPVKLREPAGRMSHRCVIRRLELRRRLDFT